MGQRRLKPDLICCLNCLKVEPRSGCDANVVGMSLIVCGCRPAGAAETADQIEQVLNDRTMQAEYRARLLAAEYLARLLAAVCREQQLHAESVPQQSIPRM